MNAYGCHNQPRPDPSKKLEVQDGWAFEEVKTNQGMRTVRLAVMKEIPFVGTTECKYEASVSDKKCDGCIHQRCPDPVVAP